MPTSSPRLGGEGSWRRGGNVAPEHGEDREKATGALARMIGELCDTASSESTPCKHKGHLQPSSPTSGRGAARIRVPAA
ncbi:hypothetical protein T492DRAFT_886396 [Pavlovales sp. CCMP2436]|nr:hypothetical protein T492DRAFT_886396 [Pavlovales sp. CCMP2436]